MPSNKSDQADLKTGGWNNALRAGFTLIELLVVIAILAGTPLPGAINMGLADGHVELVKLQSLWNYSWSYNWTNPATRPL